MDVVFLFVIFYPSDKSIISLYFIFSVLTNNRIMTSVRWIMIRIKSMFGLMKNLSKIDKP